MPLRHAKPKMAGMSTQRPRLIAHLDMDAFYASVELLRYPDLRGQAVVIGGGRDRQPVVQPDGTRRYATLRDYTGRGVITTCTYEARAFGVHSGMGVMKAARLAPEAVLLPVDFDEYRRYSQRFKEAVRQVAPVIEDRGIDEIYIDLTDLPGAQDDAGRAAARALKDAVLDATGLRCSVGVTPNKLLSKIASELDKPDGLTLLDAADIPTRRLAACGRTRPRRPADRHPPRAEVDQLRDHLRTRPACGARPHRAVGMLHAAVRAACRGPEAQGLRDPDRRHQAALRRFQDRDA